MNHPPISDSAFLCFERLIRILVVDNKPGAGIVSRCLENYKPYCVAHALSATNAHMMLSKNGPFHVCLFDMEMFDAHENEFSLVRNFSSKIPFIIMAGRNSFEQGFTIGNMGAFAAVKKPIDLEGPETIDLINRAFLRGMVKSKCADNLKRIVLDAMDCFLEQKPSRVKEWAEKLGIEERYFRRVWTESLGYQPRFTILLHQLIQEAFEHFNYLYFKNYSLHNSLHSSLHIKSEADFDYHNRRFSALYEKHKDIFKSMLKG
jgi:CheY-like chemotaxis protein